MCIRDRIWGLAAGLVLLFLLREIVWSLARGEFGLDIVAGPVSYTHLTLPTSDLV